ncbi:MAG: hypothetical protein JRN52_05695 [Nitrososphaerota archaeon]|nr:hypothetical protein [Nitrososphaerota archaeon]
MKAINAVALGVIIFSLALGTALGLLVQGDQPRNQTFSFTASAVYTSSPIHCGVIPKNYSNWLVIGVVGNRTGINFQTATIFTPGLNIRLDIPLNRTAYVDYRVVNSSYESIIVPLPNYFDQGNGLSLSISYYISGYAPTSQTLLETPLLAGSLSC